MSLLLAYHDKSRALVCSDDRAISFNADGEPEPLDERVPKFIFVGELILAVLGTSDVCESLRRGFSRMLADHPELSVTQLAEILPGGLVRSFARRRKDTNRPLGYDNLEAAILGYDAASRRMRAFVFVANDFIAIETTENPSNRIFALGAYGPTDKPILERLTERMRVAERKGLPWIASYFRDAVQELHKKYPVTVGEPSYFAAIDCNGTVELPADFPLAPATVPAVLAAHNVTTNKENAIAGTTRFFLGSITTPLAGGTDTQGNNDGGSMSGNINYLHIATGSNITVTGTGTVTDLQKAYDANTASFALLSATADGGSNQVYVHFSGAPGLSRRCQMLTVKVLDSLVTNTINSNNSSIIIQVVDLQTSLLLGLL